MTRTIANRRSNLWQKKEAELRGIKPKEIKTRRTIYVSGFVKLSVRAQSRTNITFRLNTIGEKGTSHIFLIEIKKTVNSLNR